MDRFFGITFCVGDLEYFRETCANAAQFDSWVVVTAEDDLDTQEFCRAAGIRYLNVESLGAFRIPKRGSLPEQALLRRVLEAWEITMPAWIAIVPPTTLLPRDFRNRAGVNCTDSSEDVIFRLSSAVPCSSWNEFFGLQSYGRWNSDEAPSATHDSGVYIFTVQVVQTSEDWTEMCMRCPKLEIAALTSCMLPVGESVHSARQFAPVEHDFTAFETELRGRLPGSGRAGLIVGVFDPEIFAILERTLDRLYFCQTQTGLGNGIASGKLVQVELKETGVYHVETGEEIGRFWETISLVFLDPLKAFGLLTARGEFPFANAIRKPIVAGTCYGYPHFPTGTVLVELLFGSPAVATNGLWIGTPKGSSVIAVHQPGDARSAFPADVGLNVFITADEDPTRVAIGLSALRRMWSGEAVVQCFGVPSFAHRVACTLNAMPLKSTELDSSDAEMQAILKRIQETASCEARQVARVLLLRDSPFECTVNLSLDASNVDLHSLREEIMTAQSPIALKGSDENGVPSVLAYRKNNAGFEDFYSRVFESAQRGQANVPFVKDALRLCFHSSPRDSSDIEWIVSESNAELLVAESRVSIRVIPNALVLSACEDGEWNSLQRNWNAIRWPAQVRRRVYLGELQISKPGQAADDPIQLRPMPDRWLQEPAIPYWIPAIIETALETTADYIVYVDPCLSALPGANLFEAFGSVDAYVSTGWQFLRQGSRVFKIPKVGPPATCFNRRWLCEILDRGFLDLEDFESGLFKAAQDTGISPPVIEATSLGWV